MRAPRIAAVVPALDEAAGIARVVEGLRAAGAHEVVVVDGGSRDGTAARARAVGAVVLREPRRGYGRACQSGAWLALGEGAEVLLFSDASEAADPADVPAVLAPVLAGQADLALGARRAVEPGAMRPLQRLGNRVAAAIIRLRTGHGYADLGTPRALTRAAFEGLALREPAHGWPAEMQLKAAQRGLRVVEVPVRYRRRRGGRSKVSGSAIGALRAAAAILRVTTGLPLGGGP